MADVKTNKEEKVPFENPFISKNVWLKGIGGIILLLCLFPKIYTGHETFVVLIFKIVVFLAILTYGIKLVKMFFKSIWKS
jgi:hypothetical protein